MTGVPMGRRVAQLNPLRLALIGFLKAYRLLISPLYGQVCRYYPSCSEYALVAVQRHGAVRGSWLAVRRLGRCHPWARGGIDHVPPVRSKHSDPSTGHDSSAIPTSARRAASPTSDSQPTTTLTGDSCSTA